MQRPFFYIELFDSSTGTIELDEETSRHAVQVLRMQAGEKLNLTDGKGNLIEAAISDAHKKHSIVRILNKRITPHDPVKIIVAISLLKNTSRFEWFLEKATEIGVNEIIPLLCERTEKQKFRHERMKSICISAMLQSQQTWLPALGDPVRLTDLLISNLAGTQKLIAYCGEGNKHAINNLPIGKFAQRQICIGPEGDFTSAEIDLALQHDFIPVSLGQTRLRSETAGIVATTILKQLNL